MFSQIVFNAFVADAKRTKIFKKYNGDKCVIELLEEGEIAFTAVPIAFTAVVVRQPLL